MDQEEEFERFESKGDFPPKEPVEPFIAGERARKRKNAPDIDGLRIPEAPLTKEKLLNFLIELKPIVEGIQELSRDDQHKAGRIIQDVRERLGEGEFSDEMEELFSDLADQYNLLLTRSTPSDQQEVLASLDKLKAMLP